MHTVKIQEYSMNKDIKTYIDIVKQILLDDTNVSASNTVKVFRGTDYPTTKLDPQRMNIMGDNLEGVGIYFTDSEHTAQHYGKVVTSAEINPTDFVGSRKPIKVLGETNVISLMKLLFSEDIEKAYYYISDYIEIDDIDSIDDTIISNLYKIIDKTLIRDWQIDMANIFGVVSFVEKWNMTMPYKGTFNDIGTSTTYVIIDPTTKINVV